MYSELEHVELLSRDAINARLEELEQEIDHLELTDAATKKKTPQSWDRIHQKISQVSNIKADRFKKLAYIETCWTLMRFYDDLKDLALSERYRKKCERLAKRLLIEDSLLGNAHDPAPFNLPELNRFFNQVKLRTEAQLTKDPLTEA